MYPIVQNKLQKKVESANRCGKEKKPLTAFEIKQ